MEQIKAIYKWLLSFLKSKWDIDDYPVRFREQGKDDPNIPHWSAQIINWWVITGLGETKNEAYKNLSESLENVKKQRENFPRPGTKVPIEFATSKDLDRYWGIASRIIDEVLGFDPEGIFVSDGSSLWDFSETDDISEYYIKIKEIFGIDVSHIESGNLVEISKYLKEKS
jgi:hypothetical protein